jgi:hypothetical protein
MSITYYLADKTKEWNLKLLKLPTDGSFNILGDIYSGYDVSGNLSLGVGISRNISGIYNLSFGYNACNKITNLNRNIGMGSNSLYNLSIKATGLSSITLSSGGFYFTYPFSGTFPLTITYQSGPVPTTWPAAFYTYTTTTSGQGGFYYGYVSSVTLIYSGSGFTSSTTFTFTTPDIGSGSPGAIFSPVYSDTNSGNDNIAIGSYALSSTTYSTKNIAIGSYALQNLNQTTSTPDLVNNIALGYYSQKGSVLPNNTIALGNYSLAGNTSTSLLYSPSNVICIGNNTMSNIQQNSGDTIVIGNDSMTFPINNGATYSNLCIGHKAMLACNGAQFNISIGNGSCVNLSAGFSNVCIGVDAGKGITTGNHNTFIGTNSGNITMNGSANYNVSIGSGVLTSVSTTFTGTRNTFINSSSHGSLTTASYNTCISLRAGTNLTSGQDNTFIGQDAGFSITDGYNNVAIGYAALSSSNVSAHDNVSIGYQSAALAPGNYNVCIGTYAGIFLDYAGGGTTASQNVFIGYYAGYGGIISSTYSNRGTNNVCIGTNAGRNLTTGSNNTFVGTVTSATLTSTGSNVTLIGYTANPTAATTSNQFVLGSGITNLKCATTTITTTSDVRDKTNIIDLPLGLDFLNKTRPVKFTWAMRPAFDSSGNEIEDLDCINRNGKVEAGFIAQELDEVQNETNTEWLNLVFKENPDRLEATAGKLLPIMVKAIQELSEKIDSLTQKLTLLENK